MIQQQQNIIIDTVDDTNNNKHSKATHTYSKWTMSSSQPTPLPPLSDPFYPDPEWAQLPSDSSWFLLEIKGGVEIQRFDLSRRKSWLLGRAADQVHIPLAHDSISRCHARLAFDSSGVLWLRDLQSRHGTKVNKKDFPAQAVGTIESNSTKPGSRGVQIFPGDVIQFGASTRIYCVEGPDECQRSNVLKKKGGAVIPGVQIQGMKPKPADTTDATLNNNTTKNEEDDGFVSWGISMDDEEVINGDEQDSFTEEERMKRQQVLEEGVNIPDKHRKAWEKIQALKYKLQNVLLESERIRKKGELTQGQEHQLKRNEEREQQLQEQILTRENDLWGKLFPDQAGNKKRKRRRPNDLVDMDDEVDDFFDRTQDKQQTSGLDKQQEEAETEESLLVKWRQLQKQLRGKEAVTDKAQQKVNHIQQRLDALHSAGDEEAFFVQNDLQLAQEQYDKLNQERKHIMKEMEETKKLMKIVNPNVDLEAQSAMAPPLGRKMMTMQPSEEASAVMPPPVQKPSSSNAYDNDNDMQPPPPVQDPPLDKKNDFMMPPPKRIRTSTETAIAATAADTTSLSTSTANNNNNAKMPAPAPPLNKGSKVVKGPAMKGPAKGPTMGGTLAALKNVTAGAHPTNTENASSNHKMEGEKKEHAINDDDRTKKNATTIDLKNLQEDTWQAPKDQDGSGYTKLNEKFAGRY